MIPTVSATSAPTVSGRSTHAVGRRAGAGAAATLTFVSNSRAELESSTLTGEAALA
jgi:hypothetical protein